MKITQCKKESDLWLDIANQLQALSDTCRDMHTRYATRERIEMEELMRENQAYLDRRDKKAAEQN